MEVLDRYLSEIRRRLPAQNADDIVAEIADELYSQIDDGAEPVDLIRAYGHPRVVAARYTGPRSLIGVDMYPLYARVLQFVITSVPALVVLAGVLRSMMVGSLDPFIGCVGLALEAAFVIFGVVTLIFAGIERSGYVQRATETWDPHRLPPANAKPLSRVSSAFEFGANAGMVLVLFTLFGSAHGYPSLTFVSNGMLTTAWQFAYAAAVIAASIVALGALAVYVNPYVTKVRFGAHLVANGLVIAGLALTLRAGPLVTGAPNHLNDMAVWIVALVIAAVALGAAAEIRKTMRSTAAPVILSEA